MRKMEAAGEELTFHKLSKGVNEFKVSLPGFDTSDGRAAIHDLFVANAFPSDDPSEGSKTIQKKQGDTTLVAFTHAKNSVLVSRMHNAHPVLTRMAQMKYVAKQSGAGDIVAFRLTRHGCKHWQYDCSLDKAQTAIQVRSPLQPFQSQSLFELLTQMKLVGWDWKRLPSKKHRQPFRCGDPQELVFHSSGFSPYLSYLQCVLRHSELHSKGVELIQHGHKAAFYQSFLKLLDGRKSVAHIGKGGDEHHGFEDDCIVGSCDLAAPDAGDTFEADSGHETGTVYCIL